MGVGYRVSWPMMRFARGGVRAFFQLFIVILSIKLQLQFHYRHPTPDTQEEYETKNFNRDCKHHHRCLHGSNGERAGKVDGRDGQV